jgi:uncharacterized protein
MITIKVKAGHGHTSIEIDGHAEGKDGNIICAGVSAVSHTAILGLNAIAENYPEQVTIEIDDEYGKL